MMEEGRMNDNIYKSESGRGQLRVKASLGWEGCVREPLQLQNLDSYEGEVIWWIAMWFMGSDAPLTSVILNVMKPIG